jgi:hypothetical protein
MKCPNCERELVEVVGRPSRWCVECEHIISDDDMDRILDAFASDGHAPEEEDDESR